MTSAASPVFEKVPANVSFPKLEEAILELWTRLDAFQESNRRRQGAKSFVFYDGPPFATGTPHYGHLLQSTIKDIVPRFWSMRGFQVERRFGWDCHGLPIESLAQKALNLNGTPEIRALGVDKFNEQCRAMVLQYVAEWRKTITRLGRWVDFDHDYKTMDRSYMESVWWVFSQLWQKGMVYKAHRIMPYSWKLTTPLSNFEAGNNYKDVQDPAITVKFKLKAPNGIGTPTLTCSQPDGSNPDKVGIYIFDNVKKEVFLLAWTTTPWTLPANLSLCVNDNIIYLLIHYKPKDELYILAENCLERIFKHPDVYTVERRLMGKDLSVPGKYRYDPLFSCFKENSESFRVLSDNFVTVNDGTGIVHLAPAYGEDDYRVCRHVHINLVDPLDEEACFDIDFLENIQVTVEQNDKKWRTTDDNRIFCKDADKGIGKRLKIDNKVFGEVQTINHSYPFCERTDTPLIYRAIEAWYVKVEEMRDRLGAANAQIRWVPENVGANRFGNWLKEARDWNISRNRFWGSCIPVWVNISNPEDRICVASVAALEQLSGAEKGSLTDLHKHTLDKIEIRTLDRVTFDQDGEVYRRTPEVLDCWFESGSMPYAQQHYPFENKAQFDQNFPAQFIGEAIDQTRGWFYTMLVLSTALFERSSFANVIVTGHILAEDGQKMSKSKKNYPDPNGVLDELGADALRTFLINSPVVRGEGVRFSETGLREMVRTVVLPYWNALSFFTTYASVDGFDPRTWTARPIAERKPLDRWILSVLQSLIRDVNHEMEAYRLYNVVPRLVAFIDQLTNTYIRLNRRRFWKSADTVDQTDAYATLYAVLTTFAKVMAPFMPFLTEEVYQRLVRTVDAEAPASVHWCDYPQPDAALIDPALEHDVSVALIVSTLGRKLRDEHKLKVRQPLPKLTVISRDPSVRAAIERFNVVVMDELNVKDLGFSADESAFCGVSVKPNFKALRRVGAKLKEIGAALATWSAVEVAQLESGGSVTVAGEALTLDDMLLQRTPVAGALVATEGNVTVALDITLTPELKHEGLAREAVSVLQTARKDAGLAVSDRIIVQWTTTDADLRTALHTHLKTIADEILANGISESDAGAMIDTNLNGLPFRFAVTKA